MNILEALSIDGFVEYYKEYLAKINELKKRYRLYRKVHGGSSKNEECAAIMRQHMDLVEEMKSVAKKYAKLCSWQELLDAMTKYPEVY